MNNMRLAFIIVIITAIVTEIVHYIVTHLTWLKKFTPKRRGIKKNIESHINKELKRTLQETFGLQVLRYDVKVEWGEKPEPTTYLSEEGDLVIKLSYEKDRTQSRSFTKALMLYLDESFMPEAKPFTDEGIYEGCKFNIAKEITLTHSAEAYRHFLSDYLTPLIKGKEKAEEILNKIETISKKKLFRTILLREIYLLAGKGITPRREIRQEVNDFVEFLWNVARKEEYEREHGSEPPLNFIKDYIKINIVLVAKKGVEGYTVYVKAAEKFFQKGAERNYLIGWGQDNIEWIKNTATQMRKKNYKQIGKEIKFYMEFPEEKIEGICFIFERAASPRR